MPTSMSKPDRGSGAARVVKCEVASAGEAKKEVRVPKYGVKCFEASVWDEKDYTTVDAEGELQAAERVCGEALVHDYTTVDAEGELQAAERVCGEALVHAGKPGQLRAQVWLVSKPSAKVILYRPPD